MGDIHKVLQNFDVAYGYYKTALSTQSEITKESHSIASARLYRGCGICLKGLGNFPKAQQCFEKSLENNLQCLQNGSTDNSHLWREIGLCYWNLNDYHQAKESFEKYLKRFELLSDSVQQTEWDLADVLQRISWCCKKEKNWEEAFKYYQKSLEKFRLLVKTPKHDSRIADLLYDIGMHFWHRDKIDEAKENLEEAKVLCKTLSQTPKVLYHLASCCELIGKCCKKQNVYNVAIENFDEARRNFEKILAKTLHRFSEVKKPDDKDLLYKMAQISKATGFCLRSSNLLLESIEHFNLALSSLEKLPSKPTYTEERAFILKNIGLNFKYLRNFQTATQYFIKSNIVNQALPASENKYSEEAFNWENSGICSEYLNNPHAALTRFRKALKIYERLPDREKYRKKIMILKRKISENTSSRQSYQNFHQY